LQAGEEAIEIKKEAAAMSQVQSEFCEIAQRAAILFSVLADLAHMGPTYLFSLTTFRELMTSSINEVAAKTPEQNTFGDAVCKTITINVHSFACRSMQILQLLNLTIICLHLEIRPKSETK